MAVVAMGPGVASAQLEDLFGTILPALTDAATPEPVPSAGSPAALVESVSGAPGAGVAQADYVYPGQVIDLGSTGRITLAYVGACVTETIIGGVVTIGPAHSSAAGGQVQALPRECDDVQVAVAADTAEAGTVVERITPFDPTLWAETTVSSARPRFSWGGGSADVKIWALDAPTPQLVWEGSGSGNGFRYPGSAPALGTGLPYKIEAAGLSAVFSIDPGYEVGSETVVLTQ